MKHALAAAACLLVLSCDPGPWQGVVVALPEAPEHWQAAFPGLRYCIEYLDPEGAWRYVIAAADTRGVTIPCARRANTPVIAWPLTVRETEAPGPLRPAGALLAGPAELKLTWEGGSLACVMKRIVDAGRDVTLFNTERLADYLGKADDPWNIDLDGVAQSILSGGFSAYDINARESRDISVTVGAGAWFLESPFGGTGEPDREGAVTLPGITLGCHALYSTGGRLIRINVESQEVTLREVPRPIGMRGAPSPASAGD
jgi:hypothetical protein